MAVGPSEAGEGIGRHSKNRGGVGGGGEPRHRPLPLVFRLSRSWTSTCNRSPPLALLAEGLDILLGEAEEGGLLLPLQRSLCQQLHLGLPQTQAVHGLVQVLVLVKDQGDAGRVGAVGLLQRSGGVQFSTSALDQDGAVRGRHRHAADVGIQEVVLAVGPHFLLVLLETFSAQSVAVTLAGVPAGLVRLLQGIREEASLGGRRGGAASHRASTGLPGLLLEPEGRGAAVLPGLGPDFVGTGSCRITVLQSRAVRHRPHSPGSWLRTGSRAGPVHRGACAWSARTRGAWLWRDCT